MLSLRLQWTNIRSSLCEKIVRSKNNNHNNNNYYCYQYYYYYYYFFDLASLKQYSFQTRPWGSQACVIRWWGCIAHAQINSCVDEFTVKAHFSLLQWTNCAQPCCLVLVCWHIRLSITVNAALLDTLAPKLSWHERILIKIKGMKTLKQKHIKINWSSRAPSQILKKKKKKKKKEKMRWRKCEKKLWMNIGRKHWTLKDKTKELRKVPWEKIKKYHF